MCCNTYKSFQTGHINSIYVLILKKDAQGCIFLFFAPKHLINRADVIFLSTDSSGRSIPTCRLNGIITDF